MGAKGKCLIRYAGFDNDEMFEDTKVLNNIQLEKKYGYSASTIKRNLKLNNYDVDNFQKISFNNIHDNILKMWEENLNAVEISKKLNVSDDCVYNHLKKANINYLNPSCDISIIKNKKDGEEFKIYKNHNYAISNFGRVYSFYSKKFLTPSIKTGINKGYIVFCINGKSKSAHRLVAETLIDNPNEYKEVNHIDMNRSNNHISNLEWCNRSQNVIHMLTDKDNYSRCVIRAIEAGMKNAKMVICLDDDITFNSISEAKIFYGIKGVEQISRVCTGKNSYVKDKNGRKLKFEFVEGDTNE